MRFPALILVPVLALGLTAAHAASLPDTGQSLCDNGSDVLATCTNANSGDTATNATPGSPIHVESNPTGVANFVEKASRLYERAWRTRSRRGSALEMSVKRWLAWVEGGLGGRPFDVRRELGEHGVVDHLWQRLVAAGLAATVSDMVTSC